MAIISSKHFASIISSKHFASLRMSPIVVERIKSKGQKIASKDILVLYDLIKTSRAIESPRKGPSAPEN